MEPIEELRLAGLRWAVGELPAEELPNLATEAIVRGLDSPALRELAGARPGDFWHLKRLLEAVLDDFSIVIPDEQSALWLLAKHTATEIVQGKITPERGARRLWHEISPRLQREGDLRIFIGLASELEDHPAERGRLEAEVVAAARSLSQQAEPRRWVRVHARCGQSPTTDSGTEQPIPLSSLPVRVELVTAFSRWQADYDASCEAGGFASQNAAENFVEIGRRLAVELQQELGPQWNVEYYQEPTRPPGLRLA